MAKLGQARQSAPFPTSETKATSEYLGVFGGVWEDPSNPIDKYMLVDCQEAFVIGEVVVIDATGLATQITSTSTGLVGIIVQTVDGSDTAAWAQIEGANATAICDSDVTTAAFLFAPATTEGGFFDLLVSTDANVVYGARCTVAPSTATTPFTSASDASAIVGVATVFLQRGGAYVAGVAASMGVST